VSCLVNPLVFPKLIDYAEKTFRSVKPSVWGGTRMRSLTRHGSWAVVGLLLVVPIAPAADEEAIQAAIHRGVAALKKKQEADGTWSFPQHATGATALAGLTLLECDVPATDPAVLLAIKALRPATPELTDTYSLSLAILFLDRLGDPGDVPLIQAMAVRLVAGQDSAGGWSYHCPAPDNEEVRRLTKLVRNRRELVVPREPRASSAPKPLDHRTLPREIQDQLRRVKPANQPPRGDNSNTKFATLALWVARRHGMPVENALAAVESRFRSGQNDDGGWGYTPAVADVRRQSFGTMTCAGLLGVAIGHVGAGETSRRDDPKAKHVKRIPGGSSGDLGKDPATRAGLLLLGRLLGRPTDQEGPVSLFNPRGDEYYFLWALERVAVAYSLKTIGNKDWYAWGAELLLTRQQRNGAWEGQFGEGVDTCFALLFLRRANLSKDLSAQLKGRVTDPGEVTLTTGGVGGRSLPGRNGTREKSSGGSPTVDELDRDAKRLATALLKSVPAEQDELLERYKQTQGVVYTQALAVAIPQLKGATQTKARDALAERLGRMTTATLRGRLQDEDSEMRRAAARACAMKADAAPVPDLINLLDDPQPAVASAAHAALKELADGKDFGPEPGADRTERQAAMAAWKAWWDKQKK
jgi:hypothetical protein